MGWLSFQCRRRGVLPSKREVPVLLLAHIGVGKEQPPSKTAARKIFFRKQSEVKDNRM